MRSISILQRKPCKAENKEKALAKKIPCVITIVFFKKKIDMALALICMSWQFFVIADDTETEGIKSWTDLDVTKTHCWYSIC